MAKAVEDWTFEDDRFDLKTYTEQLTQLIINENVIKMKNNQGLVIALDSSWGTGKTTLLHMWRNMLGEEAYKDKIIPVYYNAWENDDYENALIPLVATINSKQGERVADLVNKLGGVLESLLTHGIKHFTGIDLTEISKDLHARLDCEFKARIDSKNEFREALGKIPEDGQKLVIFIDELDRCRPTFAVETLEAVKHYFNVENVVFVFALDMEQLSHSIATMYGQNMDATGYLRRFFDIKCRIPKPNIIEYIEYLFDNFDSSDLQYFSNKDYYINHCVLLFDKLNFSLRDVNFAFTALVLFFTTNKVTDFNNCSTLVHIYILFISLKIKRPDLLQKILYTKFEANVEIKDLLLNTNNNNFVELYNKFNNSQMLKTRNELINNIGCFDYTRKERQKIGTWYLEFETVPNGIPINQYIHNKLEVLDLLGRLNSESAD